MRVVGSQRLSYMEDGDKNTRGRKEKGFIKLIRETISDQKKFSWRDGFVKFSNRGCGK